MSAAGPLYDRCRQTAEEAKRWSRQLAKATGRARTRALHAIADALVARKPELLEANARDVEAAREAGTGTARIDRLLLSESRIEQMAAGVRDVAALPDPVGEVIEG